jgi:hypothetical protein
MTTIPAHVSACDRPGGSFSPTLLVSPAEASAARFFTRTSDRDNLPDMAPVDRRRGGDIMEPKSIERRAIVLGSAGILAAAVLTGGCSQILGIEELSTPDEYAVRGTATGVLGPVALELRLGDDVELLAVTQEGTFSFETKLEDGASYTVALANPDVPCTLRNQTGVISGSDTAIELTCTVPALATVVVSGIAPTVTLVPSTTAYVIDLPLSQPAVTLTATVATAGDTLAIAGTPVASGMPSADIALGLGDNHVDIVLENVLGWQRTYRLTLRRAAQLAQYAYGKASNTGTRDYFGYSVALSGDTLAVGAWGEDSAATGVNGNQADNTASESGAVYVFRRTGTTWLQEAYLKPCNTDAGDRFGFSVALSDDTLAVGAWHEDGAAQGLSCDSADNGVQDSGAVYVFRRTGTDWLQEAYLKASDPSVSDLFGNSVALSGDTLAVGAFLEDSAPQDDSGAVYVFRHTGTDWRQEAHLKASNIGASDYFGNSVALSGDTLAVGAYLEGSGVDGDQNDDSALQSGAVYVFRRTGTDWRQEAYLKASNIGAGDQFGWRVALSGDTLAVAAYQEDSKAQGVGGDQTDDSVPDSGAVYVFRRTGAIWQQEAYVKASNTDAGDHFGISVALSGDTLAVGARNEDSAAQSVGGNQDDNSASSSGGVYVFRRTGTAWQQEAYVKASNTGVNDEFGWSVALSGDTLAVGGPNEDSATTGVEDNQPDDSAEDSGAVYVFH